MIKKYTLKFIFVVSIAFLLPVTLFSQMAVVGYADGKKYVNANNYTSFPSNEQLDRLTHVIASDIGCMDDGRLFTGKLPDFWESAPPSNYIWNGSKNKWLASLINKAHAKGVNASISVGGDYFPQATNSTNINTFVSNIVNFVNVHGFDGVDINWEYPGDSLEWSQCIALLQALKDNLPVKRITIALSHSRHVYNNYTHVPQQILSIADGLYLMTYDEGDWPNHSDVAESIDAINEWITWGTPTCAQKKKLFLGSAFYGWHPVVDGERVSYRDYILNNDTRWYSNPGDLPADVRDKAIHTRDNGFGGVFIWELGYDLPANDSQSLLKAIDDVRPSLSGPSIVCNSWVSYIVDNLPQGTTVSWDKSENLVRSDKMGPFSFQVRAASPAANGPGWVKAIISGSCDTV
ncbi:MAG: glycoside hydrolase family 18 protein, partial [Bacteroidales bacterium]|nr:glycoside hydrolase family 18 protein [Bacteroidales bacterium]